VTGGAGDGDRNRTAMPTGGDADGAGAPVDRETRHWYGVAAVGFGLFGAGVVTRSAALVLCAAVGIVFAGYGRWGGEPADPSAIQISREVPDADDQSAEEVEVRVAVTNTGERFLPDLRIVDGVPPGIEVVEGAARCGTALRAGEAVHFEYTVAPARGEHTWDPARVVVANASGSVERETTVDAGAETTIRRAPVPLSTGRLPVRGLTSQFEGRVGTDAAGSGIEFFTTRKYRPGDPLRRIDWKRFARTGELGAVDFRQEHGVSVVLLVDARKSAYVAPAPDAPHAVDRSVMAAGRIFDALLDSGDRAGIAAFGEDEVWLPPGAGDGHRARANALLTEHPTLSVNPPSRELFDTFLDERQEELLERRVERLHRRLPADAQVFCFSPCCDGFMPSVVRRLDAHGHLVTVISPDPTVADTPGHYLAGVARDHRLRTLDREGLRVVEWRAAEDLESALARARARWSA